MLFLLAHLAFNLHGIKLLINRANFLTFKSLLELLGFPLIMEGKSSFCRINHDKLMINHFFIFISLFLYSHILINE